MCQPKKQITEKKKHSVHLKWAKNFRAPNHYSSHSFATAKWWAFSDCCPGIFSKTPREALLRKTQVSGVEKYSTVLFAKELIVFISGIFPPPQKKHKLFEDSCRIFKTLKIYSIGP